MKDVAAGLPTDRELPDRECAGPQGLVEVGPPGGGHGLTIACVAVGDASHVGNDKEDETRISLLDRREVSIAGLDVLRLYRRQLRQRNQDLANSLGDLLLLRGSELSKPECLVLHFNLARAAQVDFIVGLNRDRRQERKCDQQKKA
jgi:hypothetical protein